MNPTFLLEFNRLGTLKYYLGHFKLSILVRGLGAKAQSTTASQHSRQTQSNTGRGLESRCSRSIRSECAVVGLRRSNQLTILRYANDGLIGIPDRADTSGTNLDDDCPGSECDCAASFGGS
jgi:hypothetical protein